jgi:hypothetical protein
MRPYLVLMTVVLMAVAVFGQQPFPRPSPCVYGCGPYIPLVTTPMISLETVSPDPVGASNATTGLIAGATNSTLSQLQGSTSSVSTVPVWYQGGDSPLITPEIHLAPEAIGREGRLMHPAMPEEHGREEHARQPAERGAWTYVAGPDRSSSAVLTGNEAKGARQAGHVYNNDDVLRQNEKNGDVKYDGKTEKL